MLSREAHLQVVNALDVGKRAAKASVGQIPELRESFRLKWPEIVERIGAGIIVHLVATHPAAQREHGIGTHHVIPAWRDVEGLKLGALIGGPKRIAGDGVQDNGARGIAQCR